jgi:adenylate cyclase
MSELESNEAQWRTLLAGDDPKLPAYRRRMRVLPSSPRCKTCLMPFGGIGGFVMRALGGGPWEKNPRFCRRCYTNFNGLGVGGAEVELSLLFADVRGSTALAEQMNAREFRDLMNRFYATATEVLVEHDAVVDKFVGDEVVALFVPGMVGARHASLAIAAAQHLLGATGHRSAGRPWLPVGIGVHTGRAFVGLVGTVGSEVEFTALGDAVNTTARLASAASEGEILVSQPAATAAGFDTSELEERHLELKGRSEPVNVRVLRVA